MSDARRDPPRWIDYACLGCIALAFLALRMPVMFRTRAGMDEEYYAVPGIMVCRSGIPRIPYVPNRDRESVFWNVDRVLLAEPPLVFYLQGAMVAVLGESLGAVRTASSLMGVVMLFVVYRLGVEWFGSRRAGLLAALALSVSRGFYFPAITARPDATAITWCLAAVWVMARGARRPGVSLGEAALAGGFLGLGFLTHPIAVVGFAQQSLWILWRGRRRFAWLKPWLVMCGACGLAASPFLVFLVAYPEEFMLQFGHNILRPGSRYVGSAAMNPFETLVFHLRNFLWQMTLWQSVFLAVGGLAGALVRPKEGSRHFVYCLWSTPLLVAFALGGHPGWAFYLYFVAVLCAGLGRVADVVLERLAPARPGGYVAGRARRFIATSAVVGGLLVAFLPGSGVRTTYAHLCNWNNPNYVADRFVERVLKDIPKDAPLIAHEELILHVWQRRPKAVIGVVTPKFFDVREHDAAIEYALLRPLDRERTAEKIGGLVSQRVYGDLEDIFSLKTELYKRQAPP